MPNRINIIITDDDADDHDFFKSALKNVKIVGHNIRSVYNGNELMDILLRRGRYRRRKDVKPDFIVLDLNLPVLDGFAALQEIKSQDHLKDIPVFILTTSNDQKDKVKCAEMGCSGFYTKPSELTEWEHVIEDILFKSTSRF
jgi:CheY-like chemotaxis protein